MVANPSLTRFRIGESGLCIMIGRQPPLFFRRHRLYLRSIGEAFIPVDLRLWRARRWNGLSAWLGVGARRRIAGVGNCPCCDCRGIGAGTGASSGLAEPSSRGAGVGLGLRLRGFRRPQRGLGALTLPGPHRPDGQKERRQEQCQIGKPYPPHPSQVESDSCS